MMTPSLTSSSLGAAFHRLAASSVNSSRAAAAPCRTAGTVLGVVRLPAVMPSSGTRAVSAITNRILSALTRSSSAAAWVNWARGPWPSSTLPVITVIVAILVDVKPGGHGPRAPAVAPPLAEGNLLAYRDEQSPPSVCRNARRFSSNSQAKPLGRWTRTGANVFLKIFLIMIGYTVNSDWIVRLRDFSRGQRRRASGELVAPPLAARAALAGGPADLTVHLSCRPSEPP